MQESEDNVCEVPHGAELGVYVGTFSPEFCSVLILLTTGRYRYSFAQLFTSCTLPSARKSEKADTNLTNEIVPE